MHELVVQATEVIFPVLSGAAGGVASGYTDEAGSRLYNAVTRLVEKVRHLIATEDDRVALEEALQEALVQGLVDERELERLLVLDRSRGNTFNNYLEGAPSTLINQANIDTYNA